MISFTGEVVKINFDNDATGFRVTTIQTPQGKQVKLVGKYPKVGLGETLSAKGTIENNKYGESLKVEHLEKRLPTTKDATFKFLKSGMIFGIGPVLASSIMTAFGTEFFNIMDTAPDRLLEVPGIGEAKKDEILKGWQKYKDVHALMVYLQDYELPLRKIQEIHEKYGTEALKVVQENPYTLLTDIGGIGFDKIDSVSLRNGISPTSPYRITAGLIHSLRDFSMQGHVCAPLNEWIKKSCELMRVQKSDLKDSILKLKDTEYIKLQATNLSSNPYVYLSHFYEAEVSVAEKLAEVKETVDENVKAPKDIMEDIKELEERFEIELSDEQKLAIVKAATEKLFILTGSAGVGKTTVCNFIVEFFKKNKKRFFLCSPTGKAAQRLAEVTNETAYTIHKLLGWDVVDGGFLHHANNLLPTDVILIDEFSMVDLKLFDSVLQALPSKAQIILVGDDNQLPSVQPGDVLSDLIKSGMFYVANLKKIYRQAEKSYIVKASHAIKDGKEIPLKKYSPEEFNKGVDFFFMEEEDPEATNRVIQRLVDRVLPLHGFSKDDIQILSPMKKYHNGVFKINQYMQELVNPEEITRREAYIGSYLLRMGDRVIQTRNDYIKDIFNGDVGYVTDVDNENNVIQVEFSGNRVVEFKFSEALDLQLAYALTIHKSQGSQYPVIIIPLTREHKPMLFKNLLYTGVTRAKKLVIIVGEKRHLLKAAETENNTKRYSCLLSRLKKVGGSESTPVTNNQPSSKVNHQAFLMRSNR